MNRDFLHSLGVGEVFRHIHATAFMLHVDHCEIGQQ